MYINEHGQKVFVGSEVAALQPSAMFHRLLERIHYKTTFQDLPISVENRIGSIRSGTDPKTGEEWRTKMKTPYGYIRGTKGADGDHLDVFVGGVEHASFAYVIHCMKDEGKTFDEDKVMLGFKTAQSAKNCFLQHYDDPCFYGGIEKIPMWKFHDIAFVKKITTKKIKESKQKPEINEGKGAAEEGASLQVPKGMLERIHNFEKAVGGRDTDQIMKKSILGKHIMVNPGVRESSEGGQGSGRHTELEKRITSLVKSIELTKDPVGKKILARRLENLRDEVQKKMDEGGPGSGPHGVSGIKWGSAGRHEEPTRIAARQHGFKDSEKIPGVFHKGHETVVTKKDGTWAHTSLDHGTVKGGNHTGLHEFLQDHEKHNHFDLESREGGPGSGPKEHIEKAGMKFKGSQMLDYKGGIHSFEHPDYPGKTLSMRGDDIKSPQSVKDYAASKDMNFGKMHDLANKGAKANESLEHGVKGMQWGVHHARKDAAGARGTKVATNPGKQAPGANKRPLKRVDNGAQPNRTLSQMQVSPQLQQATIKAQNAANKAPKGNSPHEAHEYALEALKELGMKVLEVGAKLTGTEDILNSVKSVLGAVDKHKQTIGKIALKTDKEGNHKLEPDDSARHGKLLGKAGGQVGTNTPLGKMMNAFAGAIANGRGVSKQDYQKFRAEKDKLSKSSGGKNSSYLNNLDNNLVRPHVMKESNRIERLGVFLREAKKVKVYYSRPIEHYNSEAEDTDLDLIEESEPDADLIFPATKNHSKLGMDYFHKKIDKADKVVIKASKKNKLTLGVFSETVHALKNKKPVYAIHKGRLRRVRHVEALGKPNKNGTFGRIIFKQKRKNA